MEKNFIWAEIIGWFCYKYPLLICPYPVYQIDGLVHLEFLKKHKALGIDDFSTFKEEFKKRLLEAKKYPESYAVQLQIPDLF